MEKSTEKLRCEKCDGGVITYTVDPQPQGCQVTVSPCDKCNYQYRDMDEIFKLKTA